MLLASLSSNIYFILIIKYYVVDAGLWNTKRFLAPYKGVRYHLQSSEGVKESLQMAKSCSTIGIHLYAMLLKEHLDHGKVDSKYYDNI